MESLSLYYQSNVNYLARTKTVFLYCNCIGVTICHISAHITYRLKRAKIVIFCLFLCNHNSKFSLIIWMH